MFRVTQGKRRVRCVGLKSSNALLIMQSLASLNDCGRKWLCFAFSFLFLVQLHAASSIKVRHERSCPSPSSMAAEVETDGRTSWLAGRLDVARTKKPPAEMLYCGDFIGDSAGFSWFLSRHFAIKSDLDEASVSEALLLLELAYPQLEAIFGVSPVFSDKTRLAIVYASSRNALKRAMLDDDMHVFTLGGVMQEGYSCAYLYAGTPYQSRYILLHETLHLFQYCISGNTRGCYGFFVEGVADFFSSHVYNPSKKMLTVNVADRAPLHNHLAKGLEEWRSLKNPDFSSLYSNPKPSRGISVLLCAFLQSTPSFESAWFRYCNGILRRGELTGKERSDELLLELYGGANAVDKRFGSWARSIEPSYRLLTREFDQEGESIVSCYPASLQSPASMLLPYVNSSGGDFVCDWPGDDNYICPEGIDSKLDIKWNVPPLTNSFANISFVSSYGKTLLECALTNASTVGLAFYTVNGVRYENMSFRRLSSRLQEGLSLELSLSSSPSVSLRHNDSVIASVPIDAKAVSDLKSSRIKISASMAGISFRLWDKVKTKSGDKLPTGHRFATTEKTDFKPTAAPDRSGSTLTDWFVLGPFALPNGVFTNLKYNVSQFVGRDDEIFKLSDGSFSPWIACEVNNTPLASAPIVNLPRAFGRQANYSVAFARTVFESAMDCKATLVLGVTDGVEVFVNGERVGQIFSQREWKDANSHFDIKLKRGKNEILLKLTHSVGVWLLNGRVI